MIDKENTVLLTHPPGATFVFLVLEIIPECYHKIELFLMKVKTYF